MLDIAHEHTSESHLRTVFCRPLNKLANRISLEDLLSSKDPSRAGQELEQEDGEVV